jgi:transcriptional regulator CtsR
MHRDEYLMHFFYAIGESLEEGEARAYVQNLEGNGFITAREANMMLNAVCDGALSDIAPEGRRIVRANIFKHILLSLM